MFPFQIAFLSVMFVLSFLLFVILVVLVLYVCCRIKIKFVSNLFLSHGYYSEADLGDEESAQASDHHESTLAAGGDLDLDLDLEPVVINKADVEALEKHLIEQQILNQRQRLERRSSAPMMKGHKGRKGQNKTNKRERRKSGRFD